MISKRVKRFCKDYHLIENYQQAVNDDSQMWDCHHRREISENKSAKQLIAEGLYYDVNPDELIFIPRSEHSKLHKPSEETKQKMSEAMKGERNPMFGKHHSDESRKKPVQCIETGEVFESLNDAARKYNLSSGPISECCNGKRKSCGKLHWKFVE